jgi:hypothetical protein
MNADPPFSVLVRAKGPLIEFKITGDGGEVEDMSCIMSVEDAAKLRLAIVDAIIDAKRAKVTRSGRK